MIWELLFLAFMSIVILYLSAVVMFIIRDSHERNKVR